MNFESSAIALGGVLHRDSKQFSKHKSLIVTGSAVTISVDVYFCRSILLQHTFQDF
jgi:hypothetical protein